MRINWKLLAGFSLFGGVISLISGIAGGNPFGVILLRLLLSAIVFGALGLGVQTVLRRYLPDLLQAAPRAERGSGDSVDIIIDEELPVSGQPESLEEPGAAAETPAPEEVFADEEILPMAPGENLEPDFAGRQVGAAPATDAADSDAEYDGVGDMEVLPEIDAVDDAGGSEFAVEPEEAEAAQGSRPDRRAPSTPREVRQAQIEETVKDQDPENLARAVRTFLKKDQ